MPFKPGVSGNPKGRPKGSRDKITKQTEDLLAALTGGVKAKKSLEKLRDEQPGIFWRVVASLLPKVVEATIDATLAITKIERIIVKAADKDG